jgi:xylulose-5-phosphate/fructose-6-phosphate phosphoketolase
MSRNMDLARRIMGAITGKGTLSPELPARKADAAEQHYSEAIQRRHLYVTENGDDLPEIKDWRWPKQPGAGRLRTSRMQAHSAAH